MAYYLDSSALAKLVVAEAGTNALRAWLDDAKGALVSADLARTELLRSVRRVAPERMRRARDVLDRLMVLKMTPELFESAARLEPPGLRSLDALHVAAALALGDELDGIVTYDARLAGAAAGLGVAVFAPR